MLRSFLRKIKYIGMSSVIIGLIMANFFHAFLMSTEPVLLADSGMGACHGREAGADSKQPSSQNNLLPCCADENRGEASAVFALFDFNKLVRPFSTHFKQAVPIDSEDASVPYFLNPPNQVALDKIVLRI